MWCVSHYLTYDGIGTGRRIKPSQERSDLRACQRMDAGGQKVLTAHHISLSCFYEVTAQGSPDVTGTASTNGPAPINHATAPIWGQWESETSVFSEWLDVLYIYIYIYIYTHTRQKGLLRWLGWWTVYSLFVIHFCHWFEWQFCESWDRQTDRHTQMTHVPTKTK